MKLVFIISIITSTLVLGVTIVTQKGMGLYSLRQWGEKKNMRILEPLFLCHWCMPSVYSILGFVFGYQLNIFSELGIYLLWSYLLVVCLSSFMCGLFWSLFLLINSVILRYSIQDDDNE